MNDGKVFTGSTQGAAEAVRGAGIASEKRKPSQPFGSVGRVLQGGCSSYRFFLFSSFLC